MSDLLNLLSELDQRGILLWSDAGKLRFRAPEGALDDSLRATLRGRKQEILDFLADGKESATATAPPLVALPRGGELPLSFAQERMWFLDRLEGGRSIHYNEPAISELFGPLDTHALARAFSAVVARHEALRSHFPEVSGKPRLVVEDPAPVPLPEVDLTGLSKEAREAEAHRLGVAEAKRPFDLATGPLLRLTLLVFGTQGNGHEPHHRLLLTLHHIASDGWSAGRLLEEVGEHYGAFCEGRTPRVPDLPVQYPDYAAWQRRWLDGAALERQLTWWRKHLADLDPAPLPLPTDRPRPLTMGRRAGVLDWHVGEDLGQPLGTLANATGVSLYMVMLSAYATLLSRLSGRLDPTLGSPIAGRTRPELEPLLGFFVNTLVMRLHLGDNPTFQELLHRTRAMTLGAFEHQDLPFERLVEALGVERSTAHTPIFQVMFGMFTNPQEAQALPGLRMSGISPPTAEAKFDLTLLLTAFGSRIHGRLEYRRDLFDHTTVTRLMEQYRTLLAAVAEDPHRTTDSLSLLTPGQRHQLVVEWNEGAAGPAPQPALHRCLERHREERPEAIALVLDDQQISWRHLLDSTETLARVLHHHGLTPGSRIALCLERGPRRILALLAILRAGAAWVPLAPTDPPRRKAFLLEDSGATLLLTEQDLLEGLPPERPTTLEIGALLREETPMDSLQDPVDGGWPAYLTYTSGTTGRPKGVEVPQAAVLRLVEDIDYVHLSPEETLLHHSPLAFDASTFEIWGALVHGGRLALLPPGLASPEELAHCLVRQRVSTLWLTAGLFHLMVDERPQALTQVSQILAGGEALSVPHVETLRSSFRGWLVNGYGPTENTTFSCAHGVTPDEIFQPSVPIGRPIPGSSAQVVDHRGHLAPIGVEGELWVGGHGLAFGYAGRPALTAQRFVPAPEGERFYRTGDRSRTRADGVLEFFGRIDHQVKLRGFRIEPGEIENTLADLPGVREAVVLARSHGTNGSNGTNGSAQNLRLVAYFTSGEPHPTVEHLARELADRLPPYMVPSAWVPLDELPRTANDKIDRAALPEPGTSHGESTTEPPRGAAEEILAELFGELLGTVPEDRHANFFELGGQSLLAIRLVSRLRAVFQRELQVRTVFDAPTLAELAVRIESGEDTVSLPIPPTPEGEAPQVSFSQERLWFLDRLLEGQAHLYTVPVALRLKGALDPAALAYALGKVSQRHSTLRSRFLERDGLPDLRFAPPAAPALPLVDLGALPLRLREKEEGRLLKRLTRWPFDLATDSLVHAHLLRSGVGSHLFVLNMHHIVCDETSLEILVRELEAYYIARTNGRHAALDPLPLQFHDFARWQRQRLEGPLLERQLAFWTRRLQDLPVLELPTDHPRPPFQGSHGALHFLRWPAETARALERLAQSRGATPFMTLLAVFSALLARTSGQRDFALGTPSTQRRHRDVDGLIGFFVDTLVLRFETQAEATAHDLVELARRRTLQAFDHRDVPFEKLVTAVGAQRDASRSPLFQAMLSWRNIEGAPERLGDLGIEVVDLTADVSRFDLTFTLGFQDGGLAGNLEYSRDLFEPLTMERFAHRLRYLLETMAAEPDQEVETLSLLTPEERGQLFTWEEARTTEPPVEPLLHRRLIERAEAQPETLAVQDAEGQITYGALVRRVHHLARRLRREWGVGSENAVAVLAERSIDAVVALFAVLEAGGVYLPLDPEFPAERLAFQLQDSEAVGVLLGREELAEKLPPEPPRLLLEATRGFKDHPPKVDLHGDHLAYVIYTSGTTGKPKGVAVSHRAMANHMDWQQSTLPAGSHTRVLQKTALVFDVSFCEIFGPLFAGGLLVAAPAGDEKDPRALARHMAAKRINSLHLTPALLQGLLEVDAFEGVHLETLTCGGEAVPVRLAERYFEKTGGPLVNCYGPTETAIDSTSWPYVPEAGRGGTPYLSIGHPIHNLHTRVLDRRGRRQAPGIPGELLMGGPSLARGYLGRPGLTAARFVPDAGAKTPGTRLYRTGDLVRHLPDGRLEFLGRIDHQVKLRGVRIELGEVEVTLRSLDGISDAAAALRPVGDSVQLVAGFHAKNGIDRRRIRQDLTALLPEALVPTLLFPLDAVPRTVNGKVDRRALVEAAGQAMAEHAEGPAVGLLEEQLVKVYGELLDLDDEARRGLGAGSHFFLLGGHSLLATRLVSRLRRIVRLEVPLRLVFEHPEVRHLARALEELRRQEDPLGLPTIEPRDEEDEFPPLSFAQQRLWFLARMDGPSPTYNMPGALGLQGQLHRTALEKTLEAILERHEALRTRFPAREGEPLQIIERTPRHALPLVDLEGLPPALQESTAHALMQQEAWRPFNLTRGPVLRTLLLRLGDEHHHLLFNTHHIVSDGWSVGVLIREMSTLYDAFRRGRPSPLESLRVQYADFARWQRTHFTESHLAHQVNFWRRTLEGAPDRLELPTDRPRPPVMGHRGRQGVTLRLPATTIEALEALEEATGTTRFMTLASAYFLLLARTADRRDVVVGTPIANRGRAELEPLVGFFSNTLPLRLRLDEEATGRHLVERLRQAAIDAYDHQDVPFEHLVEVLEPRRDLSHTPLFQHFFLLDETPLETLHFEGITFEPLELQTSTAKFDLLLGMVATPDGILGGFEYRDELFDATTVERLTRAYGRLLEGMAHHPDQPVHDLPWLEAAEEHQLLAEWSESPTPRESSLTELVAITAQQKPEAVALVSSDAALTYRTLLGLARRLAAELRREGLGADQAAALVAERRIETLVALLAILEAGGGCLPLDPTYPEERLAFMLRDTQSPLMLGSEDELQSLPHADRKTLPLDSSWFRERSGLDVPPPTSSPAPESLAYVVYTSGSTGRPKGVGMGHGALAGLVRWQHGDGPPRRTAQLTSLGFDVSFQEVFATWIAGGTLVLAQNELRRDPWALQGWLGEQRVERLFLPFVALQHLAESERLPRPRTLREVITAGEQLQTTEAIQGLFRAMPKARLFNQYGPSETHVATEHPLPADHHQWPELPPIGGPVAGRRAWVLDRQLKPRPTGQVGELYLGGRGLARGYLGRPALTAQRFLPTPKALVMSPGERLYKTGDLARFLADGSIEFLGRADQQVKIRGFRVEPGEIEVALASSPAVAECAVVVADSSTGDRQLVACYRPRDGAPVDAALLRAHLEGLLPAPMVPARFRALETLPLTATGKVDRRRLAEIVDGGAEGETAPAPAPRSRATEPAPEGAVDSVEGRLAAIWARLLGLQRVRPHENFFELGGHSLLMVRVQNEIRKQFDRDVGIVELFRFPTVATLARHLAPEAAPAAEALFEVNQPPVASPEALPTPAAVTSVTQGTPPVAVIGFAGRFPGAEDVDTFWHNIRDGVESITFFSREELLKAGMAPQMVDHPDYVPAKGVLPDVELFDARFFGLSASEAEVMDPQQRLFLETSWQALESTGYLSDDYSGRVGVFAGSGFNSYLFRHLYPNLENLGSTNPLQLLIGSEKDFLATTVSYRLNLRGPSLNVQTACSTSLVAVHLACRSLAAGECEMALAGGVGVHLPMTQGYLYEKGMIYSPTGHCRPFSGEADGTVGGDGVAAVILKPLDRALADGDTLYAVVRGSALNNDGNLKVGFTAPGVDGQAGAIREALENADVPPASIGYVETHGSGTTLGDPVEVSALAQAFGDAPKGVCALGALKANVGHLDAAAGVSSLIKTTLALHHRELPAGLHGEAPHPQIDFEQGPFYLNRERRPWPQGDTPRRAGVSSFGIGGTNVHVVLEEAPEPRSTDPASGTWPLVLSARSPEALETRRTQLIEHLEQNPETSLADLAYTLAAGRRAFEFRLAVLAADVEEAREALGDPGLHLDPSEDPGNDRDALAGGLRGAAGEERSRAAARLWLAEAQVDWRSFFSPSGRRRFLPLPTYPFERRRYWIDAPAQPVAPTTTAPSTPEAPQTNGQEAAAPTAPKRPERPIHPRPNLPVPLVPPETEEEEELAALWKDLLRVEPIGMLDNFFELGGHSLVATQMLLRLREHFNITLDLATLFEYPTPRKLLEAVHNELWTRSALEGAGDADGEDFEEEGEL